MKLFIILVLFAAALPWLTSAAFPSTQIKSFTANVLVHYPHMSNGGLMSATMRYHWSPTGEKGYYSLEYGVSVGLLAIYQYNVEKGMGNQANPFYDQFIQNTPAACNCDTDLLEEPMPMLFADPTYFTDQGMMTIPPVSTYPGSTACTKYVPNFASSSLSYIAVNPTSGALCMASFKDGREIYVRSQSAPNFDPTTDFDLLDDCTCQRPLDICVAVERSSAVTREQWLVQQNWLSTFWHQFTISSANTLFSVVTFNTKATVELPLLGGNTPSQVQMAISNMQCSNPDQNSPICSVGRVSLAEGITTCANQLASSTRFNAGKVILVVTSHPTDTKLSSPAAYNSATHDCVGAACDADLIAAANAAKTRINGLNIIVEALDPAGFTPSLNSIVAKPSRDIVQTTWSVAADNNMMQLLRSRACAANQYPCGSACCGLCVCSTCTKVDACDDGQYCTLESVPNGQICCRGSARSCAASNQCNIGSCNEASRSCTNTPKTCPPNNDCYTYACNPSSGVCVATFLGSTSNRCAPQVCSNSTGVPTLVTDPVTCPANTACNTYACSPSTGQCVNTAVPRPTDTDRCHVYSCHNVNGWSYVNRTCSGSTVCRTASCNPASGCVTVNHNCIDSSDKCDTSYCDPNQATVNCVSRTKSCPATQSGNACMVIKTPANFPNENLTVNGCNRQSGNCEYVPKVCPVGTGCQVPVCNPQTGACGFTIDPQCGQAQCAGENCPSDVCVTRRCDPSVGSMNCNIEYKARNCSAGQPDNCLTLDTAFVSPQDTRGTHPGCDPSKPDAPCVFKAVTCTWAGALPNCQERVRDPNVQGCCVQRPKICNASNDCMVASCSMATGQCVETPKCGVSDACTIRSCDLGVCSTQAVTCTPPDPCFPTPSCDPVAGCSFAPLNCDDNNACTADTCEAGVCVHTAKVCDDLNACTTDTCNAQGNCVFTLNTCDDADQCTTDTCDTLLGCVHTPINISVVCNDNNLCTNDTCVPSTGCVNTPITCADGNPCTTTNCTAFEGCQLGPVVCPGETCRVGLCDAANNNGAGEWDGTSPMSFCSMQDMACAPDAVLVVGAALGTAAVIGIVIGIVVCLAATGGGVFAYYKRQGLGQVHSIANNPLYKADGRSGENPLFRTND